LQFAGLSGVNSAGWTDDIIGPKFGLTPALTFARSSDRDGAKSEPPPVFEKQGKGDEDDVTASSTQTDSREWTRSAIVLVPLQRVWPIAEISGERFASIRDLYKRRWFTGVYSSNSTTLTVRSVAHLLGRNCPYLPIISAFKYMRGSLRLFIELTSTATTSTQLGFMTFPDQASIVGNSGGAVANTYTAGATNNLNVQFQTETGIIPTGFGSPIAFPSGGLGKSWVLNATNRAITIEIPFEWGDRVFPMESINPNQFPDTNNPWGYIMWGSDNTCSFTMRIGFADDFHLGHMFRHPVGAPLYPGNDTRPFWLQPP
jgi:hypothetical protein